MNLLRRKNLPWTEKHRINNIDELYSQDSVKLLMKNSLDTKEFPNLLLYGPSGTGKSSSILSICKQLFGPKIFKDRVIELNASDDRGINVVRDKIKKFANLSIGGSDPDYPCPNFKVIILDEADNMTIDAQSALRRIMETTTRVTRFCIICNYITKIINPITSRCVKYKFVPIPTNDMLSKLNNILDIENVKTFPKDILNDIIIYSKGDLRKAISCLQSIVLLSVKNKERNVFEKISGYISEDIYDEIIDNIYSYDSDTIVEDTIALAQSICNTTISATNICDKFYEYTINSEEFNENKKAKIILFLSKCNKRLSEGSNEFLMNLNILTQMQVMIKT